MLIKGETNCFNYHKQKSYHKTNIHEMNQLCMDKLFKKNEIFVEQYKYNLRKHM